MIIDKLENLKKYESVNPLFAKVVEFLQQNDLNALEAGKHEIVGKDLFANISVTSCLRQSITPRRTSPRFPIWQLTAMLLASQA